VFLSPHLDEPLPTYGRLWRPSPFAVSPLIGNSRVHATPVRSDGNGPRPFSVSPYFTAGALGGGALMNEAIATPNGPVRPAEYWGLMWLSSRQTITPSRRAGHRD
jgi:hypothetical protein